MPTHTYGRLHVLMALLLCLGGCDQAVKAVIKAKSTSKARAPTPKTLPTVNDLEIVPNDSAVRLFLPDGERGLREYKTREQIEAPQRRFVIIVHNKHPLGSDQYRIADLSAEKKTYPTTIINQALFTKYQYAVANAAAIAESVVLDVEVASIFMKDNQPKRRRLARNTSGKKRKRRPIKLKFKPKKEAIDISSSGGQQTKHVRGSRYRRVTFYSAKWCGVCKHAKRYLLAKRIPHKYIDIDRSKSGRKAFYDTCKRSGKSRCPVPTFKIGHRTMFGWSASRFEQLARY